jgi:hydroxymethylglutaryl-CoA lyase
MQGLKEFIPTAVKVAYINQLLQAGFDTLDFGSFVSPKAIPQMRDTAEVLAQLDLSKTATKLLAIVANSRGAEEAAQHPEIHYLGYPFSISETFQLRNTNATIEESLERVQQIQDICVASGKEMTLYVSMGFGNPYGDPWNVEIVQQWVDRLRIMGIRIFQLSDTIGVASPESIKYLFSHLTASYPDLEIGGHFHTAPLQWEEKIRAAYETGCRRFDGAIRGFGGCPMAKDDLVGNMPTENMLRFFVEQGENTGVDLAIFNAALDMAGEFFPH